MRSSTMRFVVIAGLLSLSATVAMAKTAGNTAPYYVVELTASVPSFPDLPQEEDFVCGDVTGDGLVNVLDIISVVTYVMGGSPNPFNMDAADITADDNINVLDIIAMVNIIMQVPGQPCGCVAPVLYEGQTYTTVQIGEQCWFKENLNVGTKINSTTDGFQQMDNGVTEKYCHNNDEAYCSIYGGLYEWPEAMQYVITEGTQGICPTGWHVPLDDEWKILEGSVDSQYPIGDPEWDGMGYRGFDAGGNLKEPGTTHWNPPNEGATNTSDFTSLPGGYRDGDNNSGNFSYFGDRSIFWSSSQNDTFQAWYRSLYSSHTFVIRSICPKDYGFSVRCLKGCWPEPTQSNAGVDQLNIPGTSTILAGNAPTYGSGLWTIVSGTGGTVVTPTSPTSGFQGVAGNEYTLSWTITTVCGSSGDEVVVSFAPGSGQPCPGVPTIEYEGQTYNTVQIGDQCWLKENLNVGTRINSTQGGYQQTNNGIIEKYCYNNDEANCDVYGGLYEWPEAMQYVTTEGAQGICPPGWHIPTDNEWKILEGTVDSQYPVGDPEWNNTGWRGLDAGGNLKEAGTTHWASPNEGATNSSGFTGLPGGYRDIGTHGYFYSIDTYGIFWSSSQSSASTAWDRGLHYTHANVSRNQERKAFGLSMRCLKDD